MNSLRSLLNVALVLVLVCVALVLVARQSGGAASDTESAPTTQWYTCGGRDSLPHEYIWTATVSEEPTEAADMRCLLVGQSVRLELRIGRAGVRLVEQTARDRKRTIVDKNWRTPLQLGDRITVAKRRGRLGVYLNGEWTTQAFFPLQGWPRALWQAEAGGTPFLSFEFQRTGPVHFSDDFMHAPEEFGEWAPRTGEWTIHTLDNPVRSANAFSLRGKGLAATISAGEWFWQDYAVELSACPLGEPGFGVRLCASPARYYDVAVRTTEAGESVVRLDRIDSGFTDTLAETPVTVSPEVWYRLRVSQLDGALSVEIDGTEVLAVQDPRPLMGGGMALLSFDAENGAVFDDVSVRPAQRVRWRGQAGNDAAGRNLGGPVSLVGDWQRAGDALVAPAGGTAAIGLHAMPLENGTLSCTLGERLPAGGQLLLKGREIGDNWIALRLEGTGANATAALVLSRFGQTRVLDSVDLQSDQARGEFGLLLRGHSAYALRNDEVVCVSTQLPSAAAGGYALNATSEGTRIRLTDVNVAPTAELPSIENRVETFEYERSMGNWSSPESEWTEDGAPFGSVFWHRSDFWGDVAAEIRVADVELNGSVAFGLVLGSEKGAEEGLCRLEIGEAESEQEGSPTRVARLFVDDEQKARKALKSVPATIAIERFKGRLQARIDKETVWSLPIPSGLRSLCRVGRYGPGSRAKWARGVVIRAEGVKTYPFKKAPVDWLAARGEWDVTNRWECDPRWSFFSGVRLDGVACLWHKDRFPADVTLEFFAGPKMDRSRGGHYQYAADLNAVLGANGHDIDSGYSFMFGGWDDKGAFVVKEREVLGKDTSVVIPRKGSTHRRWFYIKARKQGDTVSYWVENKKIAEVEDDDPLTGDRLALWTYKNGMMVAYVRISAAERLPPQSVLAIQDSEPSTPYTSEE